MNYLLDFLRSQGVEKPDVPSPGALTKLTKPHLGGENPARPLSHGTDKTDETPPPTSEELAADPPDWPESWREIFDREKAANIRLGHGPGVAAALAYRHLERKAKAMGLAVADTPNHDVTTPDHGKAIASPTSDLDALVELARRQGGAWTDPTYTDVDWDHDIRDDIFP